MVNSARDHEISAEQLRAARAWLKWTHAELAQRSGVSTRTIERFELDLSVPHTRTLNSLRKALEEAGIEFVFENARPYGIRGRNSKTLVNP